MPNWCGFVMSIKGNQKDIKKFLKFFLFEDDVGTKTKKKYLARTFVHTKSYKEFCKEHKEDIEKGDLSLYGDCAWSCWSCWFEGYPNKKECITLKEACEGLDIKVNCDSEEGGGCFEESLGYNGEDTYYSSREMPTYVCKKCKNEQCLPTDCCVEDESCWECEAEGTMELKNE